MWQDAVFLAGSVFSILVLAPTLSDSVATVPIGTSVPSACLGLIYGATFFSMGMTFSAGGSILTGVLWALIAFLRSPEGGESEAEQSSSLLRSKGEHSFAD